MNKNCKYLQMLRSCWTIETCYIVSKRGQVDHQYHKICKYLQILRNYWTMERFYIANICRHFDHKYYKICKYLQILLHLQWVGLTTMATWYLEIVCICVWWRYSSPPDAACEDRLARTYRSSNRRRCVPACRISHQHRTPTRRGFELSA